VRLQADDDEIVGRLLLPRPAHAHANGIGASALLTLEDEPALLQRIVLRPACDQRDVRPRRREDAADVAADSAGAVDQYLGPALDCRQPRHPRAAVGAVEETRAWPEAAM
jgi:hypothetical protein